eukprot:CAMPEP_0181191926 /NCGR_PEP_ID=MMETSP1096-20121128/12991_1 /TAXON_ID=156174 ORGANISM="Chrysochromulina ericina, Strain CCMP281" /NCGR_SAMPLE_ID=MMETSP1096 /ASSEMBLY_ACC=CAM_ASM_000453 /LENGTH=36 /DNA_ID= /DNA_START= /DNA_END= /DNA_ORIENTATION=
MTTPVDPELIGQPLTDHHRLPHKSRWAARKALTGAT